mgnify:CR=1 FL=1
MTIPANTPPGTYYLGVIYDNATDTNAGDNDSDGWDALRITVTSADVSVSALSSSQSFAFSAEAQQMCTGDAFRLCSSEIPNIPAITACMIKHRAQLSAGCRTVMDRDLSKQGKNVAATD